MYTSFNDLEIYTYLIYDIFKKTQWLNHKIKGHTKSQNIPPPFTLFKCSKQNACQNLKEN